MASSGAAGKPGARAGQSTHSSGIPSWVRKIPKKNPKDHSFPFPSQASFRANCLQSQTRNRSCVSGSTYRPEGKGGGRELYHPPPLPHGQFLTGAGRSRPSPEPAAVRDGAGWKWVEVGAGKSWPSAGERVMNGRGHRRGPVLAVLTESEACQAIDRRQREFIKHVHAPHSRSCCFERKTPGDKTRSKSQRDADMVWNTGRQSRFSCQAPVKIKDAEEGWTERTHEPPHTSNTGLDAMSSGLKSRHMLSF